MDKITIEVDNEIAKAYREAEFEQKQYMQNLVNNLLKQIIQDKSLDDIIQDLQTQAKNNGLTQEILDDILENG